MDYANTKLDPQVLKDMRIKNVPVSKGGLGAESLEYLVRHGFATEASMEESYAEVRDRETAAEDLLERAISGEDIYRLDDQEKLDKAYEAGRIKEKLQEELDALLAEKGKRGYIKLGKTINEIVLGQTSDITTLQHELMHHWQDVIEIAAAKGNKKAQALQKQIDKIIAENKDYVKQDLNKSAEVLTEAYERWLYTGVVTDSEQQELFNSIKKFFRQVYDGVRAITGIRMNGEIDYLFRQMTGLAPIDMRGEGEINTNQQQGQVFNQPLIDGLDTNQQVPVVDLSSFKFDSSKSVKEQIKNKLDDLEKKSPFSTQTLKVLADVVTSRRKKHLKDSSRHDFLILNRDAKKRHDKEVLNLDTLIQNAVLCEIAPNNKKSKKPNVENYYYFYVPVKLGQHIYTVKLAAEEMVSEKGIDPKTVHLYDVLETKKQGTQARNTSGSYGFPASISITEMLQNVNDAEGNPYILPDMVDIDGVMRHTKNSEGRQIAHTIDGIKNFYKWFGDSKVVDEQGRPLVVFHGTNADFDTFDKTKIGSSTKNKGIFGNGFYFTDDIKLAEGYNRKNGIVVKDGTGKVMPAYLTIKKPFFWNKKDSVSIAEKMGFPKSRIKDGKLLPLIEEKQILSFTKKLKDNGYDGVVFEYKNGVKEISVFSPTQIKSVDNKGTFSPQNPNIYFQPGFHGSRHRFVKFSLEHIGTGEGAQAHGWGVYITASQDVAELYREKLIEKEASPFGIVANSFFYNNQHYFIKGDGFYVSNNAASKETEGATKLTREEFSEVYLAAVEEDRAARERDQRKGQVYEVEIPENNVLLDEQKKINKQPAKVRNGIIAAMEEAGLHKFVSAAKRGLFTGGEVYDMITRKTEGFNQKDTSMLLLKHGIEGITYDGRQDGRCYVIFNDKAVQIKKTYYQTIKAQQTGAKAADEKPSKEQIAKDLDIIKRNGVEKYEKKSGFWSQIGETAQGLILSVRQRAGAIDPKLKAFFDKLDYFQPALEKKFADQTKGWFKKYHDLTEEDKNEFDYYVYNQLHEELDIFLKEKNMTKEYQDVRNLLNFIYSISNQAGIDMGFISEYFPTSMIDHEWFMNHMKGTDKWTYIEKSLNEFERKEKEKGKILTPKERAEAVNKLIRGYKLTDPVSKPKNAKERTILYKSPELMKFYEHSDKALMKYLQGMSRAIAINKAYGKGAGFDTDATIGAIVLDLIEGGHITRAEEDTVRHLLKSRLSYSATPEVFGLIKNLGYLGMMNNITSAITQLGDLYAPFYKYSFPTAMEAIFGKKELTRKDLGLDKIWEEFSNEKWHGIAVDKLFKAVGLDMMDAFGKKVSIQASLLNLRKQAENGDVELLNRLSYTFGKDSAKVLADIKSGKVTEDVKILVFCDLADTQPIGKSGVPTGYLNHPNWRLFYQLKTFMLNQMSLFYADSMVNIQKGIKHKNKAQFLKGVQNGFKLVLLLTAGNATADVLKNLIMGREIDLEDTVVSNLLWNIGVSKYTFYKGQREGYAWALFTSYIVPPQIGTADDVQRDAKKMAQGKQELKDSMLWTFLPFGRMYYWWFGGASEEGKKRTKKLTKKVNAINRRKNKNKRREK